MEKNRLVPGELHRREIIALELNIRKEILDFIGFELKRLKDLGEAMGIEDDELKEHISILEDALLVEKEGDYCRLTPRCIAYLDECKGYEWRR